MLSFRMKNLRKYMMNTQSAIIVTERYRYTVKTNDHAVLQRYLDSNINLTVPVVYDNYTVDDLGVFTYTGMTDIESITIPEGIIKIY